jgi:DNA-binding GntR family transcriptional regulator
VAESHRTLIDALRQRDAALAEAVAKKHVLEVVDSADAE